MPDAQNNNVFIIDTNVLLYDPNALGAFKENALYVPITVIEEIDRFKKDLNETGRNARMVSRQLDALRETGSLSTGVAKPGGGTLRVVLPPTEQDLPGIFGPHSNDNLILALALHLTRTMRENRVVLVTRDTNMRIKADALGVLAEDYEHAHVTSDDRYTGITERVVSEAQLAELFELGFLESPGDAPIFPNQFLVLKSEQNPDRSAGVRYDVLRKRLKLVEDLKGGVWGIRPRNREQRFALDLLLDDSVSLVTLDGVAGTGKTLLAIACGLALVADQRRFRRLVVSRPIFPLGRDLGFLPGDISEKLNPWMKPIFDNLELLVGSAEDDESKAPRRPGNNNGNGNQQQRAPSYQPLLDQGIIEVEPLTYIRGRSLPKQFLIVDEAQNLTPHEVKTVITRAGEGTKIVLTGDPQQIDNPYVDATSNGLTYVVERFKERPEAGHVTLRKGERSRLAELAAQLL